MNRQSSPRLVGVRLTRSGPLVLVDAGAYRVAAGDEVVVEVAGQPGPQPAWVAVTPEQLVSAGGARPAGRVVGKAASVSSD
jgi:protein involved in polysaccharide export with SLBB domain